MSTVVFIFVFIISTTIVRLSDASNAHCEAEECSQQQWKEIVFRMQQQQHANFRLAQLSAASNCTACYSNPCLNGGICVPRNNGNDKYTCNCPGDTTGANCETPLTCTGNSCGLNTFCYVCNGHVNCVCQPGYSGNPNSAQGCSGETVTSCMSGDPHYTTFDNLAFDYQGTCPYVVTQPCAPGLQLPGIATPFSVRAQNVLLGANSKVSAVLSVEVFVYNQTFFVDRNQRVFVNGIRRPTPFYHPNIVTTSVAIRQFGGDTHIETDFKLKVKFRYGKLCVTVPKVPPFTGNQTLCGLAGNIDDNCLNDLLLPDMTTIPADSCKKKDDPITEVYGDRWILPNYNESCDTGVVITNGSIPCSVDNTAAARDQCKPIYDAMTATGMFAKCAAMGADVIEHMFDDCAYDYCLLPGRPQLCEALTNFVHACQDAIPGVDLGNWREQTGCFMACPMNSVYSTCVSGCEPTCSDHDNSESCIYPCYEGCECLFDFVRDDAMTLNPKPCVPVSACGCVDENGNAHAANIPWYSDDCDFMYVCINGTLNTTIISCDPHASCQLVNGDVSCKCEAGYTGDGLNCSFINYCEDITVCNQVAGNTCVDNKNGTYYCNCTAQYFSGDQCEIFKPNRHCADLYVYYNIRANGLYQIFPSFYNGGEMTVYCDMESEGGGWTSFSIPQDRLTVNKTWDEYEMGFGNVNENNYWHGLSFLCGETNEFPTSLRLEFVWCNGKPNSTWTYPEFRTNGAVDSYRVFINRAGFGTDNEGWILSNWENGIGPVFSTIDRSSANLGENTCSEVKAGTGWWFDTLMCGFANLNGIRYTCAELDDLKQDNTAIMWQFRYHPTNVEMKLRPREFPDYEAGFRKGYECSATAVSSSAQSITTTGSGETTTGSAETTTGSAETTTGSAETTTGSGETTTNDGDSTLPPDKFRRVAGTFGRGSAQARVVKDLFL